jgi:hypothetical protein
MKSAHVALTLLFGNGDTDFCWNVGSLIGKAGAFITLPFDRDARCSQAHARALKVLVYLRAHVLFDARKWAFKKNSKSRPTKGP